MRPVILAAATIAATFAAAPIARADHKGKVQWIMDVQQGQLAARKTGRPMMIFFTASW